MEKMTLSAENTGYREYRMGEIRRYKGKWEQEE